MSGWLWIGAGAVLAGAAALAVAAGRRLPVEHVTEGGLDLAQPPGAVWDVMTDIDLYPAWRRNLTHVERLPAPGAQVRWREYDRHGHTTYEVLESEAPHLLVTGIADPELPYGGTWTSVLTPAGSGSSLTITERGEIRRPLYRFVHHYLMREDREIHRYLDALAHRLAA
ncbi:SRPBCC family protein [Kitasatospora sp. NPDC004240]